MKNSKVLIAVLCAVVLIFSLAACAQQKGKIEDVTQAVTNENGELVTNDNGELVTQELEAQIVVTDASGETVTEVVTEKGGKPLTTVVNNNYVNVTQAVTVPKNAVTKKAKAAKKTTKKSKNSKTTTTTKKDGKANDETTTTTTTTAPTEPTKPITRKINITVKLPVNSGMVDTLIIKIDGEEVDRASVKLDGSDYTFTTEDKYKGEVKIKAYLKTSDTSAAVTTGDTQCVIDIPYEGIPVLADDED